MIPFTTFAQKPARLRAFFCARCKANGGKMGAAIQSAKRNNMGHADD